MELTVKRNRAGPRRGKSLGRPELMYRGGFVGGGVRPRPANTHTLRWTRRTPYPPNEVSFAPQQKSSKQNTSSPPAAVPDFDKRRSVAVNVGCCAVAAHAVLTTFSAPSSTVPASRTRARPLTDQPSSTALSRGDLRDPRQWCSRRIVRNTLNGGYAGSPRTLTFSQAPTRYPRSTRMTEERVSSMLDTLSGIARCRGCGPGVSYNGTKEA